MSKKIVKIYPLSYMQEGMLFHSLLDSSSRAYINQMTFRIRGDLDMRIVEKSFEVLMERHEVLRSFFIYDKLKSPMQAVLNYRDAGLHFEDIKDLDQKSQALHIENYRLKDREKGFDVSKDVLMRVGIFKEKEDSYSFLWSYHHIIIDGWCIGIIVKEFLQIYSCLSQGIPVSLDRAYPFSSYIEWLNKQDKALHINYWKEYLDGYEKCAVIPGKISSLEGTDKEMREYNLVFEKSLTAKLYRLANEAGVTLNTVIQAVWGILLQKYNNTNDVVFGNVVSGRPPELTGIEQMVGLFINTVPIRITSCSEETVIELIKKIHQKELESKTHEQCPLADIQTNSYLKNDLINHIMVFENYPLDKEANSTGALKGQAFTIDNVKSYEETNYSLDVTVVPGDELNINFNYDARVFDDAFVSNMAGHMSNIAVFFAESWDKALREIQILSKEEREHILYDFNKTEGDYPFNKTISQVFEEQSDKTPESIAVVYEGECLTYRELNQKANQVARMLREYNVGPESIVAIMAERSLEMIVGILAILKAGG
jgi:fengycin family lipopeptide synthetase D